MTTITPDRSREQSMAALRYGNEIRVWRSHLKRDVKRPRGLTQ